MPTLLANRYRIANEPKDLLGYGGMGKVYRAVDTQTGESVAVKALNPDVLAKDPKLLERFVREGEALRQLNHPNIVHMIAAVEEQGRHYLIMEFVEGGSLRDMLNARGCLPANEVVKIALEVADALTRAHHLNIIHRDLKPANVLLAKDGTPRLADFGIAYVQESSHITETGVLIGTVDYLSPEICQNDAPNELSDIWAFGVMMFEMLSGRLPFEGKSMTAKITAILHQPVPDLKQLMPDIPDALIDLNYRMLEKISYQRIPSVRLVAAELEGILKGREQISSGAAMPLTSFDGGLTSRPAFVGRENELKQLDKALGKAMLGHGQVVFIIGDPGQGKTALLQEFSQRAQKNNTGLVVASGDCNAYTGVGDPYLPFREIMSMLTGDVETLKEVGIIGQTQATRLWNTFPYVIQHLIESGHNLVDIFVSGADLLRRAGSIPTWPDRETWLPQLEGLVACKASQSIDPSLQQVALFEQFTRLARALAGHAPLILLLDDMQWADSGSINLLLHLGKKLEGSRVMVVGAYRPTEIAQGRGEGRHPLEAVVNELKRQFGEIEIDLSQVEGRAFVNSLLDTEPNHLDEGFREEFFRISGGHPLTAIELLRDMQESGGLMKDADGFWNVGQNLNWETVPVRVEATIAERIGRLDEQERSILRVASVQGEGFSVEVVARVLEVGEAEVVSCLSRNLDREHHLVSAQGIRQINNQRISFYRFRHILFQKYLYNSLDSVECAHLHQQVGNTLQTLYGNETEEIAVLLAIHFQKAGTNLKAADYLRQAGDRSSDLIAYQEAIDHYQQAKTAYKRALGDQWDPLQKAILERKIGESLFRKGEHQQALDHLGQALVYLGSSLPTSHWKVRLAIVGEMMQQIGHRLLPGLLPKPTNAQSSPALEEQARLAEIIGWIEAYTNPERFLLVALKGLNVFERNGISKGIGSGSMGLGVAMDAVPLFWFAEGYHKRAIAIAEQSQDPTLLCLASTGLGTHYLLMGDLDAAIQYVRQVAEIGQSIGDLRNWGWATMMLAIASFSQGNITQSLIYSQELTKLGQEGADRQSQCWGLYTQGRAQWRLGNFDQAIASLQEAIQIAEAIPSHGILIGASGDLAQCYLHQGQLDKALSTLQICQKHYLEHSIDMGHETPLFNGLAEGYLLAAERSDTANRAGWLKKAKNACRNAIGRGKKSRFALPEALRLQGTYEWLRGRPSAAQKWWRHSLALAEEKGQHYDLGRVQLEMGRRLNDRDQLESAVIIFSQIGAEWDLEQTQKALEKL